MINSLENHPEFYNYCPCILLKEWNLWQRSFLFPPFIPFHHPLKFLYCQVLQICVITTDSRPHVSIAAISKVSGQSTKWVSFFLVWDMAQHWGIFFCYKQLEFGTHINPLHQFEQIYTIICAEALWFSKYSSDYFYINWINLIKIKIWREKCSQMIRWLVTGV